MTRAAQRLEVTQSAVSHLLDKLRAIVGDPLFVKSGRGIVRHRPRRGVRCSRPRAARRDARVCRERRVRPGAVQRSGHDRRQRPAGRPAAAVAVAAGTARIRAPACAAHRPSGVPSADMLRDGQCQLVITPRPPDARATSCRSACSRTATSSITTPPPRRATAPSNYLERARHRALRVAAHARHRPLAGRARRRATFLRPRCRVSRHRLFLRGSGLLATLPGLLRANLLRGFRHRAAARRLPADADVHVSGTCATRATRCTSGCARAAERRRAGARRGRGRPPRRALAPPQARRVVSAAGRRSRSPADPGDHRAHREECGRGADEHRRRVLALAAVLLPEQRVDAEHRRAGEQHRRGLQRRARSVRRAAARRGPPAGAAPACRARSRPTGRAAPTRSPASVPPT